MTASTGNGQRLLEVRDLHKAYQKGGVTIRVLDGASFSINRGEAVSVVGKSGAGKSTLLHLLGSLDLPDAGKIVRDDPATLNSAVLDGTFILQ